MVCRKPHHWSCWRHLGPRTVGAIMTPTGERRTSRSRLTSPKRGPNEISGTILNSRNCANRNQTPLRREPPRLRGSKNIPIFVAGIVASDATLRLRKSAESPPWTWSWPSLEPRVGSGAQHAAERLRRVHAHGANVPGGAHVSRLVVGFDSVRGRCHAMASVAVKPIFGLNPSSSSSAARLSMNPSTVRAAAAAATGSDAVVDLARRQAHFDFDCLELTSRLKFLLLAFFAYQHVR